MNIIIHCVIAVYTLIWLSFYHSVLVSDTDQLKISDFGTSHALVDKSTRMTFAGTGLDGSRDDPRRAMLRES